MVKQKTNIKKLLNSKKGIYLDLGCGRNKQAEFVGMDIRPLEGVDIVHDIEKIPYPLPDEICLSVLASHIVEHLKPWLFIDIMNELWRIMKPNGRLMIATPYAGSYGYWQDPTHCNGCNEATWGYFDPTHHARLYGIYTPKPWKIIKNAWQVNGNMEVIMEKIPASDYRLEDGRITLSQKWNNVRSENVNK
jgi:SAM-dependent methyltransferase